MKPACMKKMSATPTITKNMFVPTLRCPRSWAISTTVGLPAVLATTSTAVPVAPPVGSPADAAYAMPTMRNTPRTARMAERTAAFLRMPGSSRRARSKANHLLNIHTSVRVRDRPVGRSRAVMGAVRRWTAMRCLKVPRLDRRRDDTVRGAGFGFVSSRGSLRESCVSRRGGGAERSGRVYEGRPGGHAGRPRDDGMETAMASKKIGLVIKHAGDDPEVATLPFMIATVAQTMDVDLFIVLQGEGVRLAVKGGSDAVHAEGLSPLEDLLGAVLASGVKIMVCSPCLTTRGYTEDDLRDGCYVGGAAKIVEAMLELSLIHISEPTRLGMISYAVFCLKKK